MLEFERADVEAAVDPTVWQLPFSVHDFGGCSLVPLFFEFYELAAWNSLHLTYSASKRPLVLHSSLLVVQKQRHPSNVGAPN